MTSLTVAPKVLLMPIWVVYQKDKHAASGWVPCAAFLSKSRADSWSSRELGSIPHMDMSAWNTQVYATRSPHAVEYANNDFTVCVRGNSEQPVAIKVIDLNEMPDALKAIEATLILIHEHRRFFHEAGDSEEQKIEYHKFREIIRTLTDDDFLMAPKKHI
jgi:hypothetical protein